MGVDLRMTRGHDSDLPSATKACCLIDQGWLAGRDAMVGLALRMLRWRVTKGSMSEEAIRWGEATGSRLTMSRDDGYERTKTVRDGG